MARNLCFSEEKKTVKKVIELYATVNTQKEIYKRNLLVFILQFIWAGFVHSTELGIYYPSLKTFLFYFC